MKTTWTTPSVSHLFDAYDDHVEEALGYRPLIADLIATLGRKIEVLDYGCGGGKVSRRLINAGIGYVTGVDISPVMIDKANAHPVQDQLRYLHIESATLPFEDRTFDAAVCCYVFINVHSRDELTRIASELFRVLKSGGALYLLDTHPDSTGVRYSTFQNGDVGATYRDGDARPVYLDVPRHGVFKIIDTHWEKSTYQQVLSAAGFTRLESFERVAGDIPDEQRHRLGESEAQRPPFLMLKARRP